MFHASERLPHLLTPSDYGADSRYLWEQTHLFENSWHFVGLTSALSKPGDFVTTEICGQPIQIRNFDGVIHAVSNICAHRHCLMTSKPRGNSLNLRCQYHGWEYAATGETNRIPLAQQFAPLDRESTRVPVFRVDSVGQLVFVNLSQSAPGLRTSLGDCLSLMERGFGDGWEPMLHREIDQPVNWKIPLENSLEAYHVPAIHPETFKVDPGEARTEHGLSRYGSWFRTTLPFAPHSTVDAWFQRVEGRVLHTLVGGNPTSIYEQHHVFPNILCSFTDMVSLLHIIRPTGPRQCKSVIYQFGRVGQSFLSRALCRLWGHHAAKITMTIMREDIRLYPDIQRGLDGSRQMGMLGRSEERIHHFQTWLHGQSDCAESATTPSGADVSPSKTLNECAHGTINCRRSESVAEQ